MIALQKRYFSIIIFQYGDYHGQQQDKMTSVLFMATPMKRLLYKTDQSGLKTKKAAKWQRTHHQLAIRKLAFKDRILFNRLAR